MNPKVAVITGGASGLGLATAKRLSADGWIVVALDYNEGALAALDAPIAGVLCDVADEGSIARALATVVERHGGINALVTSAGVLRVGALESMSTADFDQVFAINTRGSWLTAKEAIPFLAAARERGEEAGIVFIASVAALRHKANSGAYAASKSAVAALCKVLSVEVANRGIRVNAVAPGTVDTPMTRAHMMAESGYRASGPAPLGRHTTAEDVAGVISFLLGPDSAFVTGSVIPVDGGSSAALPSVR